MQTPSKIKCARITYRQGYIAIQPNIHPGCINIETWEIRSDLDITRLNLTDPDFPDDGVQANVELEMGVSEAEQLVQQLQAAIIAAKRDANPA